MRDFLDERPIKLKRERSSSPASGRPFLLALAFCLATGLLVFLDGQGRLAPVRHALELALTPIAGQLTALRDGAGRLLTSPLGDAALSARVAELELENGRLKDEILQLEQARAENEFLRQQLAIQRERPWRLIGAEVTVRSPDAGRRMLLISRGETDGLRPGMAVLSQLPGGPTALVGIVESVGPRTAEVLLITDIGSQVSGRIIHESKASVGLVQGQWQRGSRLRLAQLDRAVPIAPGDPVVTAGLTAALGLPLDLAAVPADIPIGSVEQVGTTEQYQHAELRPFVDPDQVSYVWVILSQDA